MDPNLPADKPVVNEVPTAPSSSRVKVFFFGVILTLLIILIPTSIYFLSQHKTLSPLATGIRGLIQKNTTSVSPTIVQQPNTNNSQITNLDFANNWKTFEDSTNGYGFLYPPSGLISPYAQDTYQGVQVASFSADITPTSSISLTTLVVPNLNISLQDYANQQNGVDSVSPSSDKPVVSQVVQTTLGHKAGFMYTITGVKNKKVFFVQLANNAFLRIKTLYAGSDTQKQEYSTILDQIIATFTFL